jgi:signal transduction histidine kinase/CheY-like chemotaxis protein
LKDHRQGSTGLFRKYIKRVSTLSIILTAGYLVTASYYDVKVLNHELATQILIRNTFLTIIIVSFFSIFIHHLLGKIENLIQEKENAEHKAAIETQFLSTMSHEIRTPMNAVIGLSNILLHENPRTDQVENLETLKFSADLLLSLINDILDYSKMEAGKVTIENLEFNLLGVVNSLKNALNIRAVDKQIQLNVDFPSAIPRQVMGDQVRLSQILTNLVGNAIKFTEKGSVDINLKLITRSKETTTIRFEIADTGIGISKDKFDQIFTSFSQAEADTTRKFGGTGLGLSITKRLLELQNSEIHLKSKLGEGSIFYFDLEFKNVIKKEAIEEKPIPNFTSFENFNGESVLLVEDNLINVMVAKKFLSKWNLKVDVAENGKIALDKVESNEYEIILMDLNMPVMDGYTATQEIRELRDTKYKTIPIIALSASAVAGFRQKAIDAGMDAFVTKPFNPEELYRVLAKFIQVPA